MSDFNQIKKFFNLKLQHCICTYNWIEKKKGMSPERAYVEITSRGKKKGTVSNLKQLETLLNAKANRDLHKKIWSEDLRKGTLSVYEIIENNLEDLAFDCMKDIIKTTSRLSELDKNDIASTVAMENRNWFMEKLNIKLPLDAHQCYICKEEYWVTGKYVKI